MSEGLYDVVIAGGGHNGLVAAFYLARAGLSVAIVEKRQQVGGPAATVEFFPGYRASITNSPGSLEPRIVADMELEALGLRWTKPNPSVVMPFPDGRIFIGWRDQKKLSDMIAETFSVNDAETYPKIFDYFNDLGRRLRVSLFEPPPDLAEITARLSSAEDRRDLANLLFGNIRSFLEARLETEEMRAVIGMLSLAGAVSPSTPGTLLALLQRPMSLYSSAAAGAHDPRNQPLRGSTGLPIGGMGSIIEAMQTRLELMGVTIRVEAEIGKFVTDSNGQIKGVALTDGTELRAPIVLSNLDPRTTLLDLTEDQHLPDFILKGLREINLGAAAFKVVLGVDAPPHFLYAPADQADVLSSCQIRIGPSMSWFEQNYRDYIDRKLTDSPRLLGLIPTFTDPTQAPEGKHLLSFNAWFFPPELQDQDWDVARDEMGNRIVQILSEYIPSLRNSIVAHRYYSPKDLEREYGIISGNFSHIDMTPQYMFANRPLPSLSNYRTPIGGLYLCGAGSWPGGTVTGLPGHNCAQAVLRDISDSRRS